jgi:hypothetical protein
MALDMITAGLEIIEKLIPDKAAKAASKIKYLEMMQAKEFKFLEADVEMAKGQMAVNAVEAANANVFVSGWRPAVGWVCVFGLAYTFILRPLLSWYASIETMPVPPPLDTAELISLLGGMLGLGTIRMAEKLKGVAR